VIGVREGVLPAGQPYLAMGRGPAVVLFPGLSWENANPTGMARRALVRPFEPLARRFELYVIGRRPGLPRGSTIQDLAGEYADAIHRAIGAPVRLIGVSTGGSIAQQFAVDHADQLSRLVLFCSACRLSPYGRGVQRALAEYSASGQPRRAWAAIGPALAATPAGGRAMQALLWSFGARMGAGDPADMITTIEAEDSFDACDQLGQITAPTLIVAGSRTYYSPALFRETAGRIPAATLLMYDGKGHAGVTGHRPAIEAVTRFLAGDA
jgi:pimeloyl-ACP methyl ester carboxylesterase